MVSRGCPYDGSQEGRMRFPFLQQRIQFSRNLRQSRYLRPAWIIPYEEASVYWLSSVFC